MTGGRIDPFKIPNITKLSHLKKAGYVSGQEAEEEDFQSVFKSAIESPTQEIGLSKHAAQRMKQRNMNIDSEEFVKLRDAIDKLKAKGGRESLVITPKAAYIVDVANNKVVTAIDKENIEDNVFTKIDSTVILS